MTFQYAGKQYEITFQHGRFPLPTAPNVMLRGTWCRVDRVDGVDGIPLRESYSYCHPKDNFCRETGRKLALKRALLAHTVDQPREFRAAAWEVYLGRSRGPKNRERLEDTQGR